jgi:hypothetical protein
MVDLRRATHCGAMPPPPPGDPGDSGDPGDEEGRPRTSGSAVSPLRAWVAENPARAVPDVDFGTRWTDPAAPDRYHRLAWIPATGELYATDTSESYVRVLARVTREEDLRRLLHGWEAVSAGADAPLQWVEDRVAGQPAADEADEASEPETCP